MKTVMGSHQGTARTYRSCPFALASLLLCATHAEASDTSAPKTHTLFRGAHKFVNEASAAAGQDVVLSLAEAKAAIATRSLIKDRPTEKRFWLNYASILLSDGRKHEAMAIRYAESVEYLEKALGIEKSDAVEDYLARIRPLVPPTNSG